MSNPSTRMASWKFYAEVQAECLSGNGPYSWREAERQLGRADLFYLMVRLLNRPDVNNDFMFDRCREIEVERDNCLDLWAREHGKSSLITFGLSIQDILRDPEVTIGIFSHTRPIAKSFASQIKREFENNEYLKDLYSDILWKEPHKEAPRWSDDGGIIVKRKNNFKEATVEAWGLVDGQPTGRHFRLRVYDDVVTRESVTTGDQIKKTTDSWDLSQNLGVSEEKGGAVRYIGTRYSLNDTYAEMISRGAAKPRIYPATSNGRMDGVPVFFSEAEWALRVRNSSRSILAAQMLQNPLADEAATFQMEWLRSYEVRPRTVNVYIMVDPSRGRSATSDNTAMAVIGVAASGTKYLIDGMCHRMTLSQRWVNLRNLYKKWSKTPGVQHIAVGYERYGAQSDDEYMLEQMDREKLHFSMQELNWTRDGTQSKRERVERLEPDFRTSRFYLPMPVLKDNKPMIWSVDKDPDSKSYREVIYRPVGGMSSQQMAAIEGGSADLLAKAIKAVDQDRRVYDVTLHLIGEYSEFPYGRNDDLIDVCSRIYDMEPRGPTIVARSDTEPVLYFDS